MTNDELIRAAIVAASIPVYALLIQKTKAYLAAQRDKHGRSLPERVGYALGSLWARGKKRVKHFL